MKLIEKIENVKHLKTSHTKLIYETEDIINVYGHKSFTKDSDPKVYYRVLDNYIYTRDDAKFIFYNHDFEIVKEILWDRVDQESYSVTKIFDLSNIIWSRSYYKKDRSRIKIFSLSTETSTKELFRVDRIKVLSQKRILHFETVSKFKNIKCKDLESNLLWSYECPEGYHITEVPHEIGDYIYFTQLKMNPRILELIKLNFISGEVEKILRVHSFGLCNKELRRVCTISSNFSDALRDVLQYYIVDLDNMTTKYGVLENYEPNDVKRHLHRKAWNDNLFYFDYSKCYSTNRPKEPILLGCFNTDTCEIVSITEIPDAQGTAIAQMKYIDDKLFFRTDANELFVYQ